MVLLVGLNSRQRGKLERPIKPKACAPADLEAAMDYAGKVTGLGDCGNWARIDPPKAVIRSRLLRVGKTPGGSGVWNIEPPYLGKSGAYSGVS